MNESADRDALMAILAPRIVTIVERASVRAVAEIEEYADFTPEQVGEGIRRDLTLAMYALAEERVLTDDDRSQMGIIGDTRAQQGVPVESMLRVYRFTLDEVFVALWEMADDGSLAPAEVVTLTRDMWRYAGPMIEVAVGAYRKRELEAAIADSQRRASVVHGLLFSGGSVASDLVSAVGLDPSAKCLAFRARSDNGDTRSLLFDLQLPGVLENGLVAPHEGDVIGVSTARPTTSCGPSTVIGVGPVGALHELPRSLAVASRVVDAAKAFGRAGVLDIEALALETVVRSEGELADALVARYITTVEPHTQAGADVLRTVDSMIHNELSVERVAEVLFVHPNTVRNRLRRYEELTGASLRSVADLTEIRLALLRAELG